MSSESEVMIAQEQAVVCKKGLFKSIEGTLILTNTRLIFSCGGEKIESLSREVNKDNSLSKKISDESDNIAIGIQAEAGIVIYSDVESLSAIPPDPSNLFIPISSIRSASGHRRIASMPILKILWKDNSIEKEADFEQTLTGGSKKKNLNDWADLINQLKSGNLPIKKLLPSPSKDTLEGKVAYVLGDMQEKGVLEIEEQVESQFKEDLDPDTVKRACENLVSQGYLKKVADPSGEEFYQKVSPLE